MPNQKRRASNAVPLTSFYGLQVGDKLRPGADLSQVGTAISEYEIETDPHPSTDGESRTMTFHEFIVHAKDYVARQDGFSEDPVKARTSYKHGLRVDKDPRKRTIIAYSASLEYAESPAGIAAKQAKLAKLQERELAKIARQEKKAEKLKAARDKQDDEIAKLEAKLEKARKAKQSAPAAAAAAPEAPAPAETKKTGSKKKASSKS